MTNGVDDSGDFGRVGAMLCFLVRELHFDKDVEWTIASIKTVGEFGGVHGLDGLE